MLTGVLLFLAAEALLLQSWPLALWAVFFFGLNTAYFKYVEEPGLERRYGRSYRDYRAGVNRWVPRMAPYTGSGTD